MACLQGEAVCQACSKKGQKSSDCLLRACELCLTSGCKCMKLLVLVWTADCEENNKQAMEKLPVVTLSSNGEIADHLRYLRPLPEAVHLAKYFKSAFANWFLYCNGKRLNLSNLRLLYNGGDEVARKKELVRALSKWISDQRKAVKYSATDLNTPKLDKEIKFPLAVTVAATDMLMVTEGHSHCVFQVTIRNDGACLRGTVTLLLKLSESSQLYGLALTGTDLYISDSSSDGGIITISLTTSDSVIIVKNGSLLCHTVHGIGVMNDGDVVSTDQGSRVIRVLSEDGAHREITDFVGSGEEMSKDGSYLAASFSQPTAVCVEGATRFVTDTAVGAVKLIIPTTSLANSGGVI
ncbi:hypothetical protein AWC38_SpisGene10213 [Stylophora pistillata]|uniref:Uncharacterized protein n=1 Tax=Stylophora pistillata TaxID=50429 RepID=A0A2B4S810_STYPI|nr:hypothetical protein AWC38_SpisGene10213 [Stylophora pistillata]